MLDHSSTKETNYDKCNNMDESQRIMLSGGKKLALKVPYPMISYIWCPRKNKNIKTEQLGSQQELQSNTPAKG